jgi:hypothetical protein
MIIKKVNPGLDSSGSGYEPMEGPCEHGNEPSGFHKILGEILDSSATGGSTQFRGVSEAITDEFCTTGLSHCTSPADGYLRFVGTFFLHFRDGGIRTVRGKNKKR